jgi:hypothetical protein
VKTYRNTTIYSLVVALYHTVILDNAHVTADITFTTSKQGKVFLKNGSSVGTVVNGSISRK